MGTSHSDIAHAWAHNLDRAHWGSSMHHDNGKLYSYSTVIGQRIELPNGNLIFLVNDKHYSTSTAKHQNYMNYAIPGGTTVSISPYHFVYEWHGLDTWSEYMFQQSVVQLIKNMLYDFYRQLEEFTSSTSLTTETNLIFPFDNASRLIDATGVTSWAKIYKIPVSEWALMSHSNEFVGKGIRKIISCYRRGKTSVADFVTAVFGANAWKRYYAFTLSARKARATRLGEPMPVVKDISLATIAKNMRESEMRKWNKMRNDWWNCNSNTTFPGAPSSVFFGGNVLLRLRRDGEMVETSKGIRLTIPQAKKIWQLIQGFRNGKIKFEPHRFHLETSSGMWTVARVGDKNIVAGCHTIAYQEIDRMAKQLKFIS